MPKHLLIGPVRAGGRRPIVSSALALWISPSGDCYEGWTDSTAEAVASLESDRLSGPRRMRLGQQSCFDRIAVGDTPFGSELRRCVHRSERASRYGATDRATVRSGRHANTLRDPEATRHASRRNAEHHAYSYRHAHDIADGNSDANSASQADRFNRWRRHGY